MRVRALTSFAYSLPVGKAGVGMASVRNAGEEFDLPDAVAVEHLSAGHVERVPDIPETAALTRGSEKAVRSAARPIR